jgi:DNA polymerase
MRLARVAEGADFEGWRASARQLLAEGVPPEAVSWVEGGLGGDLFGAPLPATARDAPRPNVPAALLGLIEALICHRDAQRFALAYRLLWRSTHGERGLIARLTDPDIVRAREAEKAVRRDSHKMKAFVRFRAVPGEARRFIAFFEPDHHIVERVAPFFVRRFTGMDWSLITPQRSAHWDGAALRLGPGGHRRDAPAEDAVEDLWRTYYASIFNPARLKVQAMQSEMPKKYWKHLPEAVLIPGLIRSAQERQDAMLAADPTTPRKRIAAPVLREPRAAPLRHAASNEEPEQN